MSTIARRPRSGTARRKPESAITGFGDHYIVIRGVDRDLYNRLDEAIDAGQHIRLAYDGRDLKLMTTGHLHEFYKLLFGKFVDVVTSVPARRPGRRRRWTEDSRPTCPTISTPRRCGSAGRR